MSIKAILTTLLVLGTSSVALARPGDNRFERHERFEHRDVRHESYRRPYEARTYYQRPYYGRYDRERLVQPVWRWRTYQRPAYIVRPIVAPAFATGRTFITIGGEACNGIQLSVGGGSAFIRQVAVEYSDGRTQLITLDSTVDYNNPLDLSTDGSAVSRIVVYGSGAAVQALPY